MAKKAPTKVCPQCGKQSHARSIACKHCKASFPVKAKSLSAEKNSAPTGCALHAAINLVKTTGSFEKAKAVLAELEAIKKL
jgi:hypothetical protein